MRRTQATLYFSRMVKNSSTENDGGLKAFRHLNIKYLTGIFASDRNSAEREKNRYAWLRQRQFISVSMLWDLRICTAH